MSDDIGLWPKWATNLVKIGIGALAIGIEVAATVATDGAVPVLEASHKIAVTSAAIGSVVGAGTNVAKHRISTGSWSGVGSRTHGIQKLVKLQDVQFIGHCLGGDFDEI